MILSFLIPNFTADNVSLITVPLNLAKWYLRNIQNISSELNDHSIKRVSETTINLTNDPKNGNPHLVRTTSSTLITSIYSWN